MADVRPFLPLRYDTAVAGGLSDLIAPPYDVIDDAEKSRLEGLSPFNAVHLELPDPPYERVRSMIQDWVDRGALYRPVRPGVVAWTQEFATADGSTATRNVILGAVGAEPYSTRQVRPHERTHAGPKEDRLRLLYGAGHQISPVYGLYPDSASQVWAAIAPTGEPEAVFVGGDGTVNRVWWVDDPGALDTLTELMESRWILIADGHHRYETAVQFAAERRAAGLGEGPHDLVMMGLTAIEDPGLAVLPTHRVLAEDPGDLSGSFDLTPVADLEELRRGLETAPASVSAFGLVRAGGLSIVTITPPSDASPAARLDVAVLESQVLIPSFGRDQAALAHDGVLTYVKDDAEAVRLVRDDSAAAAFILREMPKRAVVEVADAGETMPQKSTFFFPKLPTGVAFHSLS